MTRRLLTGTVISTSMKNTATVRVDSVNMHPKYHKRYTVSKKYLIHDPEHKAVIGDTVSFKETRPLSKLKKWVLVAVESSHS